MQQTGGIPPGLLPGHDMMTEKKLPCRITRFVIVFGLVLTFIYGLLPWLTGSVDILNRMSQSLDETGINATSYYYTDVEQVIESEQYLRTVINDK